MYLGSSSAEMFVKFQSDTMIMTPNLVASRLHEIWRQDVLPLSEYRPYICYVVLGIR